VFEVGFDTQALMTAVAVNRGFTTLENLLPVVASAPDLSLGDDDGMMMMGSSYMYGGGGYGSSYMYGGGAYNYGGGGNYYNNYYNYGGGNYYQNYYNSYGNNYGNNYYNSYGNNYGSNYGDGGGDGGRGGGGSMSSNNFTGNILPYYDDRFVGMDPVYCVTGNETTHGGPSCNVKIGGAYVMPLMTHQEGDKACACNQNNATAAAECNDFDFLIYLSYDSETYGFIEEAVDVQDLHDLQFNPDDSDVVCEDGGGGGEHSNGGGSYGGGATGYDGGDNDGGGTYGGGATYDGQGRRLADGAGRRRRLECTGGTLGSVDAALRLSIYDVTDTFINSNYYSLGKGNCKDVVDRPARWSRLATRAPTPLVEEFYECWPSPAAALAQAFGISVGNANLAADAVLMGGVGISLFLLNKIYGKKQRIYSDGDLEDKIMEMATKELEAESDDSDSDGGEDDSGDVGMMPWTKGWQERAQGANNLRQRVVLARPPTEDDGIETSPRRDLFVSGAGGVETMTLPDGNDLQNRASVGLV